VSKHLLDTEALISYLAGHQRAVGLITRLNEEDNVLGVCAINIAELYSGLSEDQRSRTDRLIDALYYFEMTAQAAKQAGSWRYDFARKGISLSVADTLIAAIAVENSATVVTGNVKDYPMVEVRILDLFTS